MIPIDYKILLLESLPTTLSDGRTILKVMEAYTLNEYTNRIIGLNFFDEWREYYKPVDEYWEINNEDSFTFSKYYSTRIRFTVASNDEVVEKTTEVNLVAGQLEYLIEPMLEIITSSTECVLNDTYDGFVLLEEPSVESITLTYSTTLRGYITAHEILKDIINWMEINFGDVFKPIRGFIVDRGSVSDVSRLVGSESLTVLSYDYTVACRKEFLKTDIDEFVPVEEVTVTIELQNEE